MDHLTLLVFSILTSTLHSHQDVATSSYNHNNKRKYGTFAYQFSFSVLSQFQVIFIAEVDYDCNVSELNTEQMQTHVCYAMVQLSNST